MCVKWRRWWSVHPPASSFSRENHVNRTRYAHRRRRATLSHQTRTRTRTTAQVHPMPIDETACSHVRTSSGAAASSASKKQAKKKRQKERRAAAAAAGAPGACEKLTLVIGGLANHHRDRDALSAQPLKQASKRAPSRPPHSALRLLRPQRLLPPQARAPRLPLIRRRTLLPSLRPLSRRRCGRRVWPRCRRPRRCATTSARC